LLVYGIFELEVPARIRHDEEAAADQEQLIALLQIAILY